MAMKMKQAPLKDLFAKMNSNTNHEGTTNGEVKSENIEHVAAKKATTNKKLSVERIYQKKTQLEHILLRPDTYIGSVEPVTEQMWVYDEEDGIVQREITYVPGLYKIFDEILVNAADNKQRDPKMDCIKIDIDPENNQISIFNNGQGIPVVEHKGEKMPVPTMIFGHLLTSSNYNDEEEKVTGGRNGYGAKLCNIFSTKFTVETASIQYKRSFKQTWAHNMSKASDPKMKDFFSTDYTRITFSPDLAKFKMQCLDKDIVSLMTRRAYDIAASTGGVKVFLNGKRLPVKNFKDYVELYIKGKEDEMGRPIKVLYEKAGDRWEVGITMSDRGFQQMSFVNSIATTKGGRHVDHVVDMIVKKLVEGIKKKNKGGVTVKPFQIKNHLWVFINCLIVNPTFDSQTKENMTLQPKSFGSKCVLTEKFTTNVTKCGIIESVLQWAKFKAENQLQTKCSGKKQTKLKGVPKLEDANDAGTKHSEDCTLILTEGDSAKALVVSGLGVVGRDKYGVFPLRGKLLNVREATHKQILENAEINAIIKILGLQYKKKYETRDDLKTLRYGKLMIMTDQDHDGSHIKGLLINFLHHNWPTLLRLPFLEEFITPIVKASKGNNSLSFYSLPEFEEWKKDTDNWHTYKIKYYKGLGTSTSKEAKEYFHDMTRHRIRFRYSGNQDDHSINMAFSKKCVDQRKEWLSNWMEECKRRRELGLAELYLYEKDTTAVNYSDFVNKELVLFSNLDNERSIPSLVDGLKPGQRKVIYVCLKRDNKEIKVQQLAGRVSEQSAYHHGDVSLMSTIINLAQNYVGSNNINLLMPIGQFGTRLLGGKDAASPRYINTMLSPLTRHIFHPNDDALLRHLYDDNLRIEPEWYIPIIPMVLVNGADGIGTGWMTRIPNFNPREIVQAIRKMLDGEEPATLKPWYKNFKGTVQELGYQRYVISGELSIIDNNKLEITELPIGTWTQSYKESVLEPMLSSEKTPALIKYESRNMKVTKSLRKYSEVKILMHVAPFHEGTLRGCGAPHILDLCNFGGGVITTMFQLPYPLPPRVGYSDYKEYNTDTTVRFVVTMSEDKLIKAENEGLHKVFKLQTSFSTSSMVLFDHNGCLRRFDNVGEVLKEFYDLRLRYYEKRKAYMEGMLQAEAAKLSNQARFILEKCDGVLIIENKKRKDIIQELVNKGYDSDPVKAWNLKQNKDAVLEEEAENSQPEENVLDKGPDFDYLLKMPMWNLTKEKKDEILKKRDDKQQEYRLLQAKTPSQLWRDDLDAFMDELDKVEAQEKAEALEGVTGKKAAKLTVGKTGRKKVQAQETLPSPMGQRVEPRIDPELRKKVEKAVAAKENKGKRAKKYDDDERDEFDQMLESNNRSLTDRLGTSPDKIEKKMKEKKKDGLKQTKLNFKAKEKDGSPKKKKKEKLSWDKDDSTGDESIASDVSLDMDVAPRDRSTSRRAAAAKVKYNYDNESEESEGDLELHDNELEPDFKPAALEEESPAKKKDGYISVSESDSEFETKSKKRNVSDSDDDYAVSKKQKKKQTTTNNRDSKSSDDLFNSLLGGSSSGGSGQVTSSAQEAADDYKFRSDSDEDVEVIPAEPKAKAPVKAVIISDNEMSSASAPSVPPPAKEQEKVAQKKKTKKLNNDAKPKPAAKKPGPKRKKNVSDSDEDTFDDKPKKKQTKGKGKKKITSDSEGDFMDDSFDESPSVAPKDREGGRARKQIKYTFDSDDVESDF